MNKILCVGEILIDFIEEKSDESLKFIANPGGAPANVAQVIGVLGGNASIIGSVGYDSLGDFLENSLKENNVSTKYLIKTSVPTTIAFVTVSKNGERDFIFYRGADKELSISSIKQDIINESDIVHFGSATAFLEGDLNEAYYYLLERSLKDDKLVSFDPNYREFFWGKNIELFKKNALNFILHSDFVKLNEEELMLISMKESLSEAIDEFKNMYSATFAITLGKKGCVIFNNEYTIEIESEKIDAVDTTGAGDAFVGTFLFNLAKYENMKSTLKNREIIAEIGKLSNNIAGKICTRYGALSALKDL
ncbi:MAG: carbohydrate kinase [Tissierellales bacterium]|nr:carbohydrate kinase [Tissierellales bacterium]